MIGLELLQLPGEYLCGCPDPSKWANCLIPFLEGKELGSVERVGQMLGVSELMILVIERVFKMWKCSHQSGWQRSLRRQITIQSKLSWV